MANFTHDDFLKFLFEYEAEHGLHEGVGAKMVPALGRRDKNEIMMLFNVFTNYINSDLAALLTFLDQNEREKFLANITKHALSVAHVNRPKTGYFDSLGFSLEGKGTVSTIKVSRDGKPNG